VTFGVPLTALKPYLIPLNGYRGLVLWSPEATTGGIAASGVARITSRSEDYIYSNSIYLHHYPPQINHSICRAEEEEEEEEEEEG
jgi:hypothetical protein